MCALPSGVHTLVVADLAQLASATPATPTLKSWLRSFHCAGSYAAVWQRCQMDLGILHKHHRPYRGHHVLRPIFYHRRQLPNPGLIDTQIAR
jgi:hypothetical protein